jgi:GPH family glycoside/pentoside/hexuronide:cation symporter
MLGGAIGYMSIVLNVGLGMNPALVGTLQAIPRFTDAITDPVMGYISDNTRSRYGRRRPYIFIGSILVGLIFALMWQLPAGYSEMFYFWFFLAGSFLFYLAYTIFATPWVALGYEMTPDYHERTRLMASQNFMGHRKQEQCCRPGQVKSQVNDFPKTVQACDPAVFEYAIYTGSFQQ